MKENLVGKSLKDVTRLVEQAGGRPFQAKQLFAWMYQKGCREIGKITELSKELRLKLAASYEIRYPELVAMKVSKQDGAKKYLLSLDDGKRIECVYLPQTTWSALCVSSQVGCAGGCTFCATGRMGFTRNLTAAEMLGQVLLARFALGEEVNTLVVMGMGEPLENLEELRSALKIIISREGMGLNQKRITVSTRGRLEHLRWLVDEDIPACLAISLVAARDRLRWELMPGLNGEKLFDLVGWCLSYQNRTRKEITLEYVLLSGVNDSAEQAERLARLVNKLECKINLITYNPVPGLSFKPPTAEAVEGFRKQLIKNKVEKVFRRKPIGSDIMGACGQLAGNSKL